MEPIEVTPKGRGFWLPSEWMEHSATWLSWPHNKATWPDNLHEARQEYLAFIKAVAQDEPVILNFADADQAQNCDKDLARMGKEIQKNIRLSICPTNDAWIRDYGPTFVIDGSRILAIDWKYNAWGGKYLPYEDDQNFVRHAINNSTAANDEDHEFQYFQSKLCFEGGAIDVDHNRIAMCTRSCVLDPNRNPGWSLKEVENELRQCLGLTQVIWLVGDAITGDDTDGHIDQIARFVPNNKILYATCSDSVDPQHDRLKRNLADLQNQITSLNLNYELIALPLPEPVIVERTQLPASYCNFYITNGSVIVPQFDQPKPDQLAMEIIGSVFTNRKIIGLPSVNLVWGLGSFHCLTQQQPQIASI